MSDGRPLVRNAGDVEQVRRAEKMVRRRRRAELADLRVVVSTAIGRRVIWRILRELGLDASVYRVEPILMAALAGQQERARWLKAEVLEADADAFFGMEREALVRQRHEDEENTEPAAATEAVDG